MSINHAEKIIESLCKKCCEYGRRIHRNNAIVGYKRIIDLYMTDFIVAMITVFAAIANMI